MWPHELRLRIEQLKTQHLRKIENFKKISKLHVIIYQCTVFLPEKLYLHSLIFVLHMTLRMVVQHSKVLSCFKQFCEFDSLHTSNFQQVKQMNQNNIRDNKKCSQNLDTSIDFREKSVSLRCETVDIKVCQLHLTEYVLEVIFH